MIRLGVMWAGVVPQQGLVNSSYVQQVIQLTDSLAAGGVAPLLDLHQDVLSRYFCGEGVPDWLAELTLSQADFPWPLPVSVDINATTHYPTLDSCLERNFGEYYFTSAVTDLFEQLYTAGSAQNTALMQYWATISSTFSQCAQVLGYELINEPFCGGLYHDPLNFLEPGKGK